MGTGSAFRLRKLANMLENLLIEPPHSNQEEKDRTNKYTIKNNSYHSRWSSAVLCAASTTSSDYVAVDVTLIFITGTSIKT